MTSNSNRKPRGYWTKDRCIQSASFFDAPNKWKASEPSAHRTAIKNKWYSECTAHMQKSRQNYWTKERCIESAQNHSNTSEWIKNEPGAYDAAHKNKWLDDCRTHFEHGRKLNGYWTKERCIESAKKFKSISKWQKSTEARAYDKALQNGWVAECTVHMEVIGNRMKRALYAFEFHDGSVYVGLTYNYEKRLYDHLKRPKNRHLKKRFKENVRYSFKKFNEWLPAKVAQQEEEALVAKYIASGWLILNIAKTGSVGGTVDKWTKQRCLADSKQYSTPVAWNRASTSSYQAAVRYGWFDECTTHMQKRVPNGYWTKQRCVSFFQQHTTIKSLKSVKQGSSCYTIASRNGWLEDCTVHMNKKRWGYWNKERCLKSASKFKSSTEWRKEEPGAYGKAKTEGWLDELKASFGSKQ